MKIHQPITLGTALTLLLTPGHAIAADTVYTQALLKKVEELEQKVKLLEEERDQDAGISAKRLKAAPTVSVGAGGLTVQSADTNFVMHIRGYVQADNRYYPDKQAAGTSSDTFLLRRVRPVFEGTVYGMFDYKMMLDFPSGTVPTAGNNAFIQDVYMNARFAPEFQVQVGKFKGPIGLERLQSARNLLFVERGYPTELVPNRDIGAMVQGELFDSRLSYAAGIFNGDGDGGSDDIETSDNEKDFEGRVFANPFRNLKSGWLNGLGIGIAGSYGRQEGPPRPYTSMGQKNFFSYYTTAGAGTPNVLADGDHWRIVPQAYYYIGPFGIFGEYALSSQQLRQAGGGLGAGREAQMFNRGWEVSASYIFTGEENSWSPLVPKHPVSLAERGWGAWEVAARAGQLTLDQAAFPIFASSTLSAHQATSWGVGLNWHLNRNIKVNLDYDQTYFSGGSGTAFTAKGEKVVMTRVQFTF